MLKHFKFYLCRLLSVAFALAPVCHAHAAAGQIGSFDAHSWRSLQRELPRPAAVVFTTTDCSHCPAVIAALAGQIEKSKRQLPLVVVVMDGEDQPELLQEAHYRAATRLLTFRGQGAALQYSVNPDWRGITPYVALFPEQGEIRMILGKPSAQEMRSWLNKETRP